MVTIYCNVILGEYTKLSHEKYGAIVFPDVQHVVQADSRLQHETQRRLGLKNAGRNLTFNTYRRIYIDARS